MAKTYRYRWTSDHAAVIDGYTTPDGEGVLAEPGREFTTTEPLDHQFARPVDKSGKAKTEEDQETKQDQESTPPTTNAPTGAPEGK